MKPGARFLPALLALILIGPLTHADAAGAWTDYQIIMWQGPSEAGAATLARIGVTAGAVHGQGDQDERAEEMKPLLDNGLGFFVENIATDFYSAYHRWSGDRPVNWRFVELQERLKRDRADRSVFRRDPSLSDPVWQKRVDDRLTQAVRDLRPYKPLYYNLADESGIADLTAAWDFDLGDASLAGMRQWLEKSYGTLAALNAEWGTHYPSWDQVMPMTTDEAMRGGDDNFAPWVDFKAWMDVAFARALASGTAAVHRGDPDALAAIEGAQVPGTGGYDYTLLTEAVDAIEMYDDGENIEIARSLNPSLVLLGTSALSGPREAHFFWRELLRGGRGLVLWDAKREYVDAQGVLGPRGKTMAPIFAELRGGLGALLINSWRQIDPIAIFYSPASIRLQWMLEQKPHGIAWSGRDASIESDPDAMRNSTAGYAGLIEHMGLQHRFIAPAAVAAGALRKEGVRVLILPMTIALSDAEAREIHAFAAEGGLVIADGEPGRYDEHGRKRAQPALADLFAPGGSGLIMAAGNDAQAREKFAQLFAAKGVVAPMTLSHPDGTPVTDVEFYRFRAGSTEVIALLRDDRGANASVADEPAILRLPRKALVTDLRRRKVAGESDQVAFTLSPYVPVVLALADKTAPAPAIAGPKQVARDASAAFALAAGAGTVLHVTVTDPHGIEVARLASNPVLTEGKATIQLRLNATDPAGTWHVSASDVLSGRTAVAEFAVTGR